ncbi:hypothetical protein AFLA_012493 [Aspergillus flavus NRRL3357]|nr:hypothetical protein AFLA_012493 [Aspergillus flavus NRRL3357]
MPHNILITGGSGYLGGTLLAAWENAKIKGYDKLFVLVRTEKQAESVKKLYGAEPYYAWISHSGVARGYSQQL